MKPPFRLRALFASLVVALLHNVNAEDPTLSVASRTDKTFVLSWPGTASDYVLESVAELKGATAWQPVTEQPTLTQGRFQLTLNPTDSARYFRLRSAGGAGLPPDPATVAPALSQSTVTDLASATAFLYT